MTDQEREIREFAESPETFYALLSKAIKWLDGLSKELALEANDYVWQTLDKVIERGRIEKIETPMAYSGTVMFHMIMKDYAKDLNNVNEIDNINLEKYIQKDKEELSKEDAEKIHQCMEVKLSKSEMNLKIYELHFMDFLPIRTIIELTGLNYHATKNKLSKMRNMVKECYKRIAQ